MAATRRLQHSVATSNTALPRRACRPLTNRQVLLLWLALVVPGALLAVAAHLLPVSPLDVAVTTEVQEHRAIDVPLTPFMLAVSAPGDYPWAVLLVGFACLVPLSRRDSRTSLLILSTVTGDGMALLLKALVQRARPSTNLVEVYAQLQGYSFPSGHVVQLGGGVFGMGKSQAKRYDGYLSGNTGMGGNPYREAFAQSPAWAGLRIWWRNA